jgi:UDP-N-acetylmuramate--alanine ligase
MSGRGDAAEAGGGGAASGGGEVSAAAKPWAGRVIHFVGVGGAGMSGYARAAAALGASVSGSDSVETPYLARLRDDRVLDAAIGYDAANVPAGDDVEVVYSSAVPAENVERAAARGRGLSERPRADLLAELTALRRTIAVAGAHGKTTTAAMVVHALRSGGLDPGWTIGGTIGGDLGNAHWSEGDWLVVEADESDRSMLSLNVEIAVLTNAELDHHAAYGSLAELLDAYAAFLARAPQAVIWDRPRLLSLREGERVAYDAIDVELRPGGSCFAWRGHEVKLSVPGAHNALNAAAALEAARLAGVREQAAIAGVEGFGGAGRRFERLGRTPSGALVIDDYAHHPTEVAATIAAARSELNGGGRLVAVFQPHLYSRTAMLADEFGRALAQADAVAVLDVYAARERQQDHEGVSGLLIARAAAEHAHGRPVMWLPRAQDADAALRNQLQPEDLCLVMGAGDVDALARGLVGA